MPSWIIQVGPKSNDQCLCREKQREIVDRQKRRYRDHGGRNWRDVAISERTPAAARSWKRQRTDSSSPEPQMSAALLTP